MFDKDAAKAHCPRKLHGPVTLFGQEVYVAEQSARIRDELDWITGNNQMVELRSFYVSRCTVNEDGERVFTDADQEWIGEKPSSELDEVYKIASAELNTEAMELLKKRSVRLASVSSGE